MDMVKKVPFVLGNAARFSQKGNGEQHNAPEANQHRFDDDDGVDDSVTA